MKKYFTEKTNCEYIPLPESYAKLNKSINKIYADFYASLNDKQKKQYDDVSELELEQQADMALQYYEEGFKLGLMLAAESALK